MIVLVVGRSSNDVCVEFIMFTADAYPIVDARSVDLLHLTTVARRGVPGTMRRGRKLAVGGKTASGKARWGSRSAPSLPSATRRRRPKTTSGVEKSSKLPPTFRGYSNNLKADLIYAKFHVDSVVAARERRHIDQARRDRMFKLQMLRKRKKEEADSNRAEERKQHQSQLLEEANANVEQDQVEDGPEDGTPQC